MTDTLVGRRPWTQEDFWEYLGAFVGEFEAGQIKTMLGEHDLVIVPTANPADFRYWEGRYRDEKARAHAADSSLSEAVKFLDRYLNETPLGHQPHMIAHEVETFLSAIRSRAAVLDSERGSTHEA